MTRGHLYDISLDLEIRTEGMHNALAVEKMIRRALDSVLQESSLVKEIERGPHVHMKASPKNFAPADGSPMTQMSKAIRLQLSKHGPKLEDVPTLALREYVTIAGAFVGDMKDELERRDEA